MTTETEIITPSANIKNLITVADELSRLIEAAKSDHPFAATGLKNAAGRARALVSDLRAALTWVDRPVDGEVVAE